MKTKRATGTKATTNWVKEAADKAAETSKERAKKLDVLGLPRIQPHRGDGAYPVRFPQEDKSDGR